MESQTVAASDPAGELHLARSGGHRRVCDPRNADFQRTAPTSDDPLDLRGRAGPPTEGIRSRTAGNV
ncbi:MAG: hypothetical protein CMJ59_07550 [Planctomycetaceae bacterium]|nr:hypothetical protein [Planctomycetaceae bacterium]